ncbi:MAG: hypothetical protein PVH61_31645 [Candidatus Aminicenantes bacterium]|jgi:LSD1 subclass zinc finger protein
MDKTEEEKTVLKALNLNKSETPEQKQAAILARYIANNELVIYCETCKTVFYAGTIKYYIETYDHDVPRDFHFLAMRHVWNNIGHRLTYDVPLDKALDSVFMQYLPDLNVLVNELKNRNPHRDAPMEYLWTGKKSVKCSCCNTIFHGLQGWLLAARCCLEKKPFAGELP